MCTSTWIRSVCKVMTSVGAFIKSDVPVFYCIRNMFVNSTNTSEIVTVSVSVIPNIFLLIDFGDLFVVYMKLNMRSVGPSCHCVCFCCCQNSWQCCIARLQTKNIIGSTGYATFYKFASSHVDRYSHITKIIFSIWKHFAFEDFKIDSLDIAGFDVWLDVSLAFTNTELLQLLNSHFLRVSKITNVI